MTHVTAFFAGILGLMFIGLSFYVIGGRYRHRLLLGDGGISDMARRVRAHANFAEYVPLALVLMAVNELSGSSPALLALLGAALAAGRLSHAYSLLVMEVRPGGHRRFRTFGMAATFTVIGALSLLAIA